MVKELDAVYENGLLRPLEPLSLAEQQRVHVRITDVTPEETQTSEKYIHRYAEMAWLAAHEFEYPGEWLALDGDTLVSHGFDDHAVRDEARRKGIERPLMVHVPKEPPLPSAGWL